MIWFIRRYGLRAFIRYQRARRRGVIVDYGRIFTPEERAVLEEHMGHVPWRGPDSPA